MCVSISEIMNNCEHLDLESCSGICTSDLHNSHCRRCGKHLMEKEPERLSTQELTRNSKESIM